MSEDKQWASKYLLDPLTAPQPSEETGPGTHFRSSVRHKPVPADPVSLDQSASVQRHRRHQSLGDSSPYRSQPSPASPHRERFPSFSREYRTDAFGPHNDAHTKRRSLDQPSSKGTAANDGPGRRRVSSLTSRFPGDQSHRPLSMLRHDAKVAQRAPHLRKSHIPAPDVIDKLDNIGMSYHHEGPYDATLFARNKASPISPVEATRYTNNEALKATPREYIQDSLDKHRPLDGVASIPPGGTDMSGTTMLYEEGTDLMIAEGDYKRWPGVEYRPDDLKGKGEPSFTIEKALKESKESKAKLHRRGLSDGHDAYEMISSAPRSGSPAEYYDHNYVGKRGSGNSKTFREWEEEAHKSKTTGHGLGEGIKRRFGSLRKKQVAPVHDAE